MTRGEPAAWLHKHETTAYVITRRVKEVWEKVNPLHVEHYTIPLYTEANDVEQRCRDRLPIALAGEENYYRNEGYREGKADARERIAELGARIAQLEVALKTIRDECFGGAAYDIAVAALAELNAAPQVTPVASGETETGQCAPRPADAAPDAFLFHIREIGKGRGREFAAIDYTLQEGEELLKKTPLYNLVAWLQSWWTRDEVWRAAQRKLYGPDVAHLLRGVADMIEAPSAPISPEPRRTR